MENCQHPIVHEADEVISVITPNKPANFRNRFIKTSLRQYLSGSFLYLDADTLVRDDISSIFSNQASLAGVPNHNGAGTSSEIPGSEMLTFTQLNWSLPSHYVNGGVIFFSDTPETYTFCNLWHQKWLECTAKIGKHFDQPSLNYAIDQSRINFTWLPHKFNAQVHARPHTAWNAVLWHIYLSEPHASPRNVLADALVRQEKDFLISPDEVQELTQRSHPWIINNILDLVAIGSLKKKKLILGPNNWERLWLSGSYLSAIFQVYNLSRKIILYQLRFLKSIANKSNKLRSPSNLK